MEVVLVPLTLWLFSISLRNSLSSPERMARKSSTFPTLANTTSTTLRSNPARSLRSRTGRPSAASPVIAFTAARNMASSVKPIVCAVRRSSGSSPFTSARRTSSTSISLTSTTFLTSASSSIRLSWPSPRLSARTKLGFFGTSAANALMMY